MSDALENKAVEILDKSQQAIASFADKLTDLAKQYGPEVADAALQMARIDALSGLVPAIFTVAATVIVGPKVVRNLRKWQEKDPYDPGPLILLVVSGAVAAIFNLAAIMTLLDVWRWVGVFEPKLWLAKRILGL